MGASLLLAVALAQGAFAQSAASVRLSILQAEGRGTGSAQDLLVIRNGARSSNADTARVAIRALGRFGRPDLIPSILVGLRHPSPDVRREAANAVAQAARGLAAQTHPSLVTVQSARDSLAARLNVESDPEVRSALCEAIARLPYTRQADVEQAESILVGFSPRGVTPAERVGLAKSLEILVRVHGSVRPPGGETIALLTSLFRQSASAGPQEAMRDARVRRLALEGLIGSNALSEDVVTLAARDRDPQVRRLAMAAAASSLSGIARLQEGLVDLSPAVRLEALRGLHRLRVETRCAASLQALADSDMAVALVAIDQMASCGQMPEAVARLERIVADLSGMASPRGWHPNAHALLALAAAAPVRAAAALARYAASDIWQLRRSAARAARLVADRATLETLAKDPEPRVGAWALAALGGAPGTAPSQAVPRPAPLTAAELTRLGAPRARITVREVGVIEVALLTSQAPATVVEFARLAEGGYYAGATFDDVEPGAFARTRTPGGTTAAARAPAEPGVWPHVRGTLSVTTGPDGAFFINLVDNPRLDHDATVFGQVLNGIDVVDRLLEGDAIESIEILP